MNSIYKSKQTEYYILAAILLTALLLRLWDISSFSLSNDELSALYRLDFDNFKGLITGGVVPDFHPAGVQVLLYYWKSLAGDSTLLIRMPFIIAGLMSVLLIYLVGKKIFNGNAGLFAAAILAVFQYPLLFSRLARPYAPGLFFILLLFYCWIIVLFEWKNKTAYKKWLYSFALGMTFALCMYTHYFSFLSAAILGIAGLTFTNKENRLPYVLSGVLAVLLFIPHLGVSVRHFSIGGLSTWLGAPPDHWILLHWSYIFNHSWVFGLLAAALLLRVLFIRKRENWLLSPRFLILLWIIPLLIGFFYSKWVNPVLQHSILLFSLPFLLLALSSALAIIPASYARWISIIILLTGSLHTVFVKEFYTTYHFADFQKVGRFVDELEKNSGKATAVAINTNNAWYLDYYRESKGSYIHTDIRDLEALRQFRKKLDSLEASTLIYASLKPEPMETNDLIMNYYPCKTMQEVHGNRSWIAVYQTVGTDCISEGRYKSIYSERLEFSMDTEPEEIDSTISGKGTGYLVLSGSREFSPAISIEKNDIPELNEYLLHARVYLKWLKGDGDPQLVGSIETRDNKPIYWRSTPTNVFFDEGGEGMLHLWMDISDLRKGDPVIKIYVYNLGGNEIALDYLDVNLY